MLKGKKNQTTHHNCQRAAMILDRQFDFATFLIWTRHDLSGIWSFEKRETDFEINSIISNKSMLNNLVEFYLWLWPHWCLALVDRVKVDGKMCTPNRSVRFHRPNWKVIPKIIESPANDVQPRFWYLIDPHECHPINCKKKQTFNSIFLTMKWPERDPRHTYAIWPTESVYRAFDGIPKTPCTNETEMMDRVDFVASPSICMCNTFPNRNAFDISAR